MKHVDRKRSWRAISCTGNWWWAFGMFGLWVVWSSFSRNFSASSKCGFMPRYGAHNLTRLWIIQASCMILCKILLLLETFEGRYKHLRLYTLKFYSTLILYLVPVHTKISRFILLFYIYLVYTKAVETRLLWSFTTLLSSWYVFIHWLVKSFILNKIGALKKSENTEILLRINLYSRVRKFIGIELALAQW